MYGHTHTHTHTHTDTRTDVEHRGTHELLTRVAAARA